MHAVQHTHTVKTLIVEFVFLYIFFFILSFKTLYHELRFQRKSTPKFSLINTNHKHSKMSESVVSWNQLICLLGDRIAWMETQRTWFYVLLRFNIVSLSFPFHHSRLFCVCIECVWETARSLKFNTIIFLGKKMYARRNTHTYTYIYTHSQNFDNVRLCFCIFFLFSPSRHCITNWDFKGNLVYSTQIINTAKWANKLFIFIQFQSNSQRIFFLFIKNPQTIFFFIAFAVVSWN